jgi:DNA-binding NarL/FixJ family response regulator
MNDASESHESSRSPESGRKIRIVVADDVPRILGAVEKRLIPKYEIVGSVGDGLALVKSVQELRPDLVITDISMPGLSGLHALRQLRALGINTPAVILSVHEDAELAREALASGALGFVLESCLQDDLQIAIRESLAGRNVCL